ncbi:PQQ-binding-like beta-propeller repeat protein [Gemmata sp. G18]|uniref:PQQ-binding-like beta-propeller repeat protein n=1 Tax=Gemmata palustris TaxID=2822762 RepID=A0ABS5BYT2_9BACT|nr:PQQ-binding-like beta-propeller repeat protein [Gemmata palustris]
MVIANLGGVKQYVQLMANGLVSFDAKTGKMLWRYGTKNDRFGGNTANIRPRSLAANSCSRRPGTGAGPRS